MLDRFLNSEFLNRESTRMVGLFVGFALVALLVSILVDRLPIWQ